MTKPGFKLYLLWRVLKVIFFGLDRPRMGCPSSTACVGIFHLGSLVRVVGGSNPRLGIQMSLGDAFAGSDARYRAHVMHATWGHLEQKRGELQKGWFVFPIAAYSGHHVLLGSDWGNLDDSPGLWDAMMAYLNRHAKRGVVMRLEGHVRRFKNGNYQIGGRRYILRIKP